MGVKGKGRLLYRFILAFINTVVQRMRKDLKSVCGGGGGGGAGGGGALTRKALETTNTRKALETTNILNMLDVSLSMTDPHVLESDYAKISHN